jgi:NosR/NirI family nitrous oxide reductase transcriptional regulator
MCSKYLDTLKHTKRQKRKRFLAVSIIVLIGIVWALGFVRSESDILPQVRRSIPEADHIIKVADGLYSAWEDSAENHFLGHIVLGEANGYGGPLKVAVAVNPSGKSIGVVIVAHKETPAWMKLVEKHELLESMVGKIYTDPFVIGHDIDGVTGATTTSNTIAEAVLLGSQEAARHLNLPVKPPIPPKIIFGTPEVTLLALFGIGFIARRRKFMYIKQSRRISMLAGMIILGFIYNRPLTLVYITKLTMGYWPRWQTDLYWYFLVGGVLLIFIFSNRNTYCEWFCPFGAAQECMGVIGGCGLPKPRYHNAMRMIQRMLALMAILLGIYFRNPGLSNYELYGTLFGLVGTSIQFAILGLVLIAAMFIRRPWCNYLCPIRPVLEIISIFRGWVRELWQKENIELRNS